MNRWVKYVHLGLLLLSAVTVLGLQLKLPGFSLIAIGLATLPLADPEFRRHFGVLYIVLAILGSVDIGTTTAFPQGPIMGLALAAAVVIPYFGLRLLYNDQSVTFPFRSKTPWSRRDIAYIFISIIAAYLVLPPMLRSGYSYLNWVIEPGFWNWAESYIGLNTVGFWDELFFISTAFVLLKKHFPLLIANIAQATLFTSFLYTLGFQGWSPLVIFPFALSQGYMFNKTHSLTYVLAIHLTIDLILHLTLIELNHPTWINFIIT